MNNSSLVPAKLREHFTKVHRPGKYKDTTHDEFKRKRARFNTNAIITSYGFVPVDKPILTTSIEMAYLIAKQSKPHIIGETLVKPAALQMVDTILGKAAKDKLFLLPLSDDVARSGIDGMSDDNLSQLLANVKGSPTKFNLQSDETTDVANLNQLYLHVILKGARSKKSFCSANSSQYLQRRPMKKRF